MWSYNNGVFNYVKSTKTTRAAVSEDNRSVTSHVHETSHHVHAGGFLEEVLRHDTATSDSGVGDADILPPGTFAEVSGGSFNHNLGVDKSVLHIRPAGASSKTTVGVIVNVATTGGTSGRHQIKTQGNVLAWIAQPYKEIIPITGIYQKQINGIDSGKTVIIHNERDGSIIFAQTRDDDDLDTLKLRMDALTTFT